MSEKDPWVLILTPEVRVPTDSVTQNVWTKVNALTWKKILTRESIVSIPPQIILRLQHILRKAQNEDIVFNYDKKPCISLWDLKDNWDQISDDIGWWERFDIIFWWDNKAVGINQHLRSFQDESWVLCSFVDILSWRVGEIQHVYKWGE